MRVLLLFVISLLGFGGELPVKVEKPSVEDLTKSWTSIQAQIQVKISEAQQQVIAVQGLNIQIRDLQLQAKDAEMKVQSALCEKGTMLVMGAEPSCKAPSK